jgi:ketosteroid isomerase-like protein
VTEATDKARAGTSKVIEGLREAMDTGNTQGFIAHFAEDAVYESPFSLAGQPNRWEGFAAISEHLGAENPTKNLLEFTKVTVEVHLGHDPEEATAQFTIQGKVRATGEQFTLPSSIGVIRVRDGKIVHYQDYTNMLRGAQIAGVLPQFAARLAQA